MFFAYLDESGTGALKDEPFAVMAAVLVHDTQWRAVDDRIANLVDEFALPEDRQHFFFHAQALYSSSGKEFKEKYPDWQRNHDFLRRLCEIPKDFRLAVSAAAFERSKARVLMPNAELDEQTTFALVTASMTCAQGIERFMREYAHEAELVTLVYEDNGKKNKKIRERHNLFRTDFVTRAKEFYPANQILQFQRIIETAMFVGKLDSRMMQLADTCAYIFSRHVRGARIDAKFIDPLLDQLMPLPGATLVATKPVGQSG